VSADRLTEPASSPLWPQDGRLVLTVEEAARIVGVGRSAAYVAIRSGELPSQRLGRRIVVPVPMLRAWLGLDVVHPVQDEAVGNQDTQ
jgi:excisionase family DNA binding protein